MLETVSATQIGLIGAILAVAYFVRGVAGFGSGLIAIPLLVHFLPLSVAVPVLAASPSPAATPTDTVAPGSSSDALTVSLPSPPGASRGGSA